VVGGPVTQLSLHEQADVADAGFELRDVFAAY
jgi:hypothetical protein